MSDPYRITADLISKQATDIWGLKFFPSLEPHYSNEVDMPYSGWPGCEEISVCNLAICHAVMKYLGNDLKACLEIGVNRNGLKSMSHIFINDRPPGSFYLGVDINDKSQLDDHVANTWTLRCNSHNQNTIRGFLKDNNIKYLDLISIDGWHSVNTTVNDWRYADMLSPHGVVLIHDTNFHPGDIAICEAVDTKLFDVFRMCIGYDSGIAAMVRKTPTSMERFSQCVIDCL